MVIPVMDIIDDTLDENSTSPDLQLCICQATRFARVTLNWYYEKTDLSNMYCTAMILHPSHKLQYFKNAEWEQEWVDIAVELVKNEFIENYSHIKDQIEGPAADDAKESKKVRDHTALANYHSYPQSSKNMFDNLLHANSTEPVQQDEVQQYLEAKTEVVDDPIKWWQARRDIYPCLSRMALDYLIIPGEASISVLLHGH